MPGPHSIDLSGRKIGKWTVLERDRKAPVGRTRWLSRCECGAVVSVTAQTLINRDSSGCRLCGRRGRGLGERRRQRPITDRFWEKVLIADGCWTWTGHIDSKGYGRLGSDHAGAHRLSWEINVGPIPDNLWVLHYCDNPSCVRPDHLFLGTIIDNLADMVSKGRHPRGETNGRAKTTEERVRAMRARHAAGAGRRELAIEFGMSLSQTGAILSRKNWKHVD